MRIYRRNRDKGVQAMASIQCEYPGCTIPAKEKCGLCGNIYCIRHIQLKGAIYTCDLCISRAITEKREEAIREQAAQAMADARLEAEMEFAVAMLEADRPRREANRKKRIKLAWIGISLMVSSLLLTFFLFGIGVFTSTQPQPDPFVSGVWEVVLGGIMWAGIITLLFILKYRD